MDTQFKLNTEEAAKTFFILSWDIEWVVEIRTEAKIICTNQLISTTTLIIKRGITFWGIDIHIKEPHSNTDKILINQVWDGAMPNLAIKITPIATSMLIWE